MPENDGIIDRTFSRLGDSNGLCLEVMIGHDGDAHVAISSPAWGGNIPIAQVEFCAPFGGGYHPETIKALYELAKAMEADNKDPESPPRYRTEADARGDG
jgi:hypothetical protein